MPKLAQYRIVKQQVESFRGLGFNTELLIQGVQNDFAPKIRLIRGTREYRFSDPNWSIVSMQLAKFYRVANNA